MRSMSLINPHHLTANIDHVHVSPVFNQKIYFACLQGMHQQWNFRREFKREFKRANEAYAYARRILVRWQRLYDARPEEQPA